MRLQVVTTEWDPVSAAIRFSTRSWASHVEFLLDDGRTFGAKKDGVKYRLASACRHYTRVELYTAPGIEDAFLWATSQSGKPYDFSAIFGIALDRDWRQTDSWFCSELVAAAFEQVSMPILNPGTVVWRVTPRDILLSLAVERL